MEKTLLLVDDEPGIPRSMNRVLRKEGYHIMVAHSGQEGLDILSNNAVQVVTSDQRMPSMTGTEFLAQVKQTQPDIIRIYSKIQGQLMCTANWAKVAFLLFVYPSNSFGRLLKERVAV